MTSCANTRIGSILDNSFLNFGRSANNNGVCFDQRLQIPRIRSDNLVLMKPNSHYRMFFRNGRPPVSTPFWTEYIIPDDSAIVKHYDPTYHAVERTKSEDDLQFRAKKQMYGKNNLTHYIYDFNKMDKKQHFHRSSYFNRCSDSRNFFNREYFNKEPESDLRLIMDINPKANKIVIDPTNVIDKIYARGDVCSQKTPEFYAIYDIEKANVRGLKLTPQQYLKAAENSFNDKFYLNNNDFAIILSDLTKAYFLEKCKDPKVGLKLHEKVKFKVLALDSTDYVPQSSKSSFFINEHKYALKQYKVTRMTWPFTKNISKNKTTKYRAIYEGNLNLYVDNDKAGYDQYLYLLRDEMRYAHVRKATIDNFNERQHRLALERMKRQERARYEQNKSLAPFIGFIEGVTLGYSDELICALLDSQDRKDSYENCHYELNRSYDEILSTDKFAYFISNMAGMMFAPTSLLYPEEWHKTPSGRAKIEAIEGVIQTIGESNAYRPVTAEDILINTTVGAALGAGIAAMKRKKQ